MNNDNIKFSEDGKAFYPWASMNDEPLLRHTVETVQKREKIALDFLEIIESEKMTYREARELLALISGKLARMSDYSLVSRS